MSLYKVFSADPCNFFLFYNLLLVQKKVIYFYLSWVKFNFSVSVNILNLAVQAVLILTRHTRSYFILKNWGYQLSRLLHAQSPMSKPILTPFLYFWRTSNPGFIDSNLFNLLEYRAPLAMPPSLLCLPPLLLISFFQSLFSVKFPVLLRRGFFNSLGQIVQSCSHF